MVVFTMIAKSYCPNGEKYFDKQQKGLYSLFFGINSSPTAKPALADLTDTHKGRGNAAMKNVATLLIAHVSSIDVTL